jgi:hypothetical protein
MAKIGKTIDNVIRGDTRVVNLTFLQSDQVTPVNLTGGTIYFSVNPTNNPSDDTSAVIEKNTTGPFTSPLTGQHTITLTHTDTNIAPATYWYDAQFVDSVGNYLSSYRGNFIVQSDIERN